MTKYHSLQTKVDGITFASRAEARRYQELRTLERAGVITGLTRQVKYPLIVNGVKVCTYVSDFDYRENGRHVTEDVKGFITPVYRLKRKLMQAIYGITITEVHP